MIERLVSHAVERPWGRRRLPSGFAAFEAGDAPVGEIWFERGGGEASALLVKYLFTSERLSIQVHPDDDAARAAGLESGKDEAWLVIDAEPDAVIGLGLNRETTAGALRGAALDGSIERLVDWRPVRAGDFFYSPAGTIHAIGGGLSLIEIQQYSDVTYRLYDYGRPRALHLDQAVAVAKPEPYQSGLAPATLGDGRQLLAAGGKFVVERWQGGLARSDDPLTVVPLDGSARLGGAPAAPGSVWLVAGEARIEGDVLVAYPGTTVRDALRRIG